LLPVTSEEVTTSTLLRLLGLEPHSSVSSRTVLHRQSSCCPSLLPLATAPSSPSFYLIDAVGRDQRRRRLSQRHLLSLSLFSLALTPDIRIYLFWQASYCFPLLSHSFPDAASMKLPLPLLLLFAVGSAAQDLTQHVNVLYVDTRRRPCSQN
jgi:hypothetical protein